MMSETVRIHPPGWLIIVDSDGAELVKERICLSVVFD